MKFIDIDNLSDDYKIYMYELSVPYIEACFRLSTYPSYKITAVRVISNKNKVTDYSNTSGFLTLLGLNSKISMCCFTGKFKNTHDVSIVVDIKRRTLNIACLKTFTEIGSILKEIDIY